MPVLFKWPHSIRYYTTLQYYDDQVAYTVNRSYMCNNGATCTARSSVCNCAAGWTGTSCSNGKCILECT